MEGAKPGFHIFPMVKTIFFAKRGAMAQCPPKYTTDPEHPRLDKQHLRSTCTEMPRYVIVELLPKVSNCIHEEVF